MVEGARLESVYTSKAYRGFESPSVRHIFFQRCPALAKNPHQLTLCGFLFAYRCPTLLIASNHLWRYF